MADMVLTGGFLLGVDAASWVGRTHVSLGKYIFYNRDKPMCLWIYVFIFIITLDNVRMLDLYKIIIIIIIHIWIRPFE